MTGGDAREGGSDVRRDPPGESAGAAGDPRGSSGDGPEPPGRLFTVARSRSLAEAHLLRGILRQAGIEAVLADENVVWANWFLISAVGGIRVQVRERDLPAALELLSQPLHAFPALAADAEPPAGPPRGAHGEPPCPECGSVDATFHEAAPEGFLLVWLEKLVPLPVLHGWWVCEECGKRWLE